MRYWMMGLVLALGTGCQSDDEDAKSGDEDATTATTDDASGDGDGSGGGGGDGSGDGSGDDGSGDDGGGDDGGGGDGSGGDGSGDDGSGDDGGDGVTLSEVNAWSEAGCALLDVTPESLVLGSSRSEANTAVLVMEEGAAWSLEMPASGDGWMTIEVPDWMTVVHFFTEEGVELEIMGGESFSDVLRNGACPDAGISDQRWAFHEWGAYTIRVAEGAPETVWFTLVKEE